MITLKTPEEIEIMAKGGKILGSIHPWSITAEFISFYKLVFPRKRLVNFFHIPIQSGSDKILQLMNRGYTVGDVSDKLDLLSSVDPFITIGTDIIVGFPNETDQDFEDTYAFLEKSPINKFHIFRYSPRVKTAAYLLSKTRKGVSKSVKVKRAKILSDLGEKKYSLFLEKQVHRTTSALFLIRRENNYQEVLLDNQIPAWIKTPKNLTREIHTVTITQHKDNSLFGELV